MKRGIYYASRLISSQFGVDFDKEAYGNLKKVYTIWICMNPPATLRNTIIGFNLGMKIIAGAESVEQKSNIEKAFKKQDYDLMSVIFVNLDKNGGGTSHLLELLSLLFLGEMKAIEKCRALEAKFGIEMYQEISEEVKNMCDLSSGVWERGMSEGLSLGVAQGMSQGLTQGITQGTARVLSLNNRLLSQGRIDDLKRASTDSTYLESLFEEFGL